MKNAPPKITVKNKPHLTNIKRKEGEYEQEEKKQEKEKIQTKDTQSYCQTFPQDW
jgi:hypothetical protein